MSKQCFSIRVDTPRATHNLSCLDRKWQFRKTLSHAFRDTDYPTTIYGHSGKPRRILSVTLMIQRPYMAIQENLVTTFHDTDDPTTIYAHSGKCRCMLTMTLTIQ